ncbi:MAG TPA: bi-domain-containing oxidoreductase [Longimicrobiales bacterium]|nr:bi-domain-containing oxidoreductase [Longimicrobiales bacterium]
MKQLLQSPSAGAATVTDVPAPAVQPGCVLVRNAASLVSAGTERTAVEFAKKSLLAKARSRPDLVRKVLDKARTDGPVPALQAALTRLDQPLALGYSCAGVVLEVGDGVEGVRPGDRVACAGAGYACHAEVVCVPRNLVALVPDAVALEHAAFATVGAIGLHGVRLAEVALGDRVAVVGLGLIGLLTVQMLRAAGARVLGVDLDPVRVKLALDLGADAAVVPAGAGEAALALSGGVGVDAVLITAGTSSNEPVELAGRIARDRGRVVVVGAVGMELPRPPFFEKELSFRVSRSYGPGRYDPVYEEGGVDYPIGYVRWTENRNLQAFLEMVASGAVRVEPLITHRIPIEEGARAYGLLTSAAAAPLGVVLTYGSAEAAASAGAPSRRVEVVAPSAGAGRASGPGVGVLGAGNFATATLLPAIQKAGGFRLTGIASAQGPSARHAAGKFGFAFAASAEEEILSDPGTDLVAILTRHDLHARQIVAALAAGKHVFCEKPPCLGEEELAGIVQALAAAGGLGGARLLALGYNRRFAPMMRRVREHMAGAGEPLMVQVRVNAGPIPAGHWIHDPAVGGGRIVGELCHFVDLAAYLTGAVPVGVHARGVPDRGRYHEDNVALTLSMSDGSVVTIAYVASGDRALGKERYELFGGGRSAVVDDFRSLRLLGGGRERTERARLAQDKGHRGEWEAIHRVLTRGGAPPIEPVSWVATSLATFAAVRSLRSGSEERMDAVGFVERARGGGTGRV